MAVPRPSDLQEQYRDSSNLAARIGLHARFSTSAVAWPAWVFSRLGLLVDSRVLEVGGGPGMLWRANGGNLPSGGRMTFTDFSHGMVAEARDAIEDARFAFGVVDAQRLPFSDGSFDVLVANHMLYHVPDLDAALAEFARVLASGGRLVAATNGRGHMRELGALLDAVGLGVARWDHVEAFGLESGVEPTGRHFDDVAVERCPNVLAVTDARAVLDYVRSMGSLRRGGADGAGAEILERVTDAIDRDGAFRITTDAGVITARKP
jgi:SAM-dependent methyltransferase